MPTPHQIINERLVEFDDATHTYYVDGDAKLSTTQVFRDASMVDTQWFTEWHRWRGSKAHRLIAAYNKTGKLDRRTIDQKIRPYVEAAIKWQEETKFTAVLVEHRMYDPIYDVCGTLDLFGGFANTQANTVVDYKTNDWKQGQLTSRWQTASYGHALDPKEIYRRIEVVLGPDGNYGPVTEFPVSRYIEDCNEFLALAITAKLRRECGMANA